MSRNLGRTTEQPYATKKHLEVGGNRFAYIDEGAGPAILFQHGSPTSSYLWRNIMPHVEGLGRIVAADLMGFGESDKVDPAEGPDRYSYQAQRARLFELWDRLDLGDEVIVVVHDIGSIYGLDWANQNRDRLQGVVYMESLVAPLLHTDFPEPFASAFQHGFPTPPPGVQPPAPTLDFVDGFLLGTREFTETERAHYRKPFLIPGEDRRPTNGTHFSVNGTPEDTTKVMGDYAEWLTNSQVPKLLVNAEPGFILNGRLLELARTFPNQTEITVPGTHFLQETSPDQIGAALAGFVRALRTTTD